MTTNYVIRSDAFAIAKHIFEARIDNADTIQARVAYRTALDVLEYLFNNDTPALDQFDYLETKAEREARENV